MDVDQDNIESVEEVELGEIRKTDSQMRDGLEIFGLSQDLHDEEKVISIVEKTKFIFDTLMFDNNQTNNESVEEVELGVNKKKVDILRQT